MQGWGKRVAIVSIVLLIPLVPFVFFGEALHDRLNDWRNDPPARATIAAIAFGLLALDVILPVPSSALVTLAGAQLGGGVATLVCWAGMTVGAALGFAAARGVGAEWARRRVTDQTKTATGAALDRYGVWALVFLRGVPVLAEASLLLAGLNGLRWRTFWLAVPASNLGLAAAYATLGDYAAEREWLPVALGVSAAAPVFLAALLWRRTRRTSPAAGDRTTPDRVEKPSDDEGPSS